MKAISLTVLIWALAQIPALAQWHGAATPPPIAESSPIPLLSGIVRMISPGDSVTGDTLDLKIAPTVQLAYRLAKVLVVVAPDGRVVPLSTVADGNAVTIHFMQDGDELVIDRIFLQ
jgi:hypothetical protein